MTFINPLMKKDGAVAASRTYNDRSVITSKLRIETLMDDVTMRKKCDEYTFYSYGNIRIFQGREAKLKSRLAFITFLGIIVPVMLGAVAAAFAADWKGFPYVIALAGVVTGVQLYFSCWSIVARWNEQYASTLDSILANTALYNSWKSLADDKSTSFSGAFKKTKDAYERQELKNVVQSITDKESRYAAHEAYLYFKNPCHIGKIMYAVSSELSGRVQEETHEY